MIPEGNSHTFAEIEDLSELTSSCYRTSNRAWLALMAVAVVVLIPRTGNEPIQLPFDLGTVSPASFFLIALIMLVATTIAFAAAHAQAFRTQRLAFSLFKDLSPSATASPTKIHPRDIFDALQHPTFNRVGPLAQLFRGRYQFFPEAASAPRHIRILVNAYYTVLKLVAFVFYFVVPSWALIRAFQAAQIVGAMRGVATLGVLVSGIALLQVMYMEFAHVVRVISTSLGTIQKAADQ